MEKQGRSIDFIEYTHPARELIKNTLNPNVDIKNIPPTIHVASFYHHPIRTSEQLEALRLEDQLELQQYSSNPDQENKQNDKHTSETLQPSPFDINQQCFLHIDVSHRPIAGSFDIPGSINIWFSRDARNSATATQALADICSGSQEPVIQELRSSLRKALLLAIQLKQPIEELHADFLSGIDGVLPPDQARVNIYLPTETTNTATHFIKSLFPEGEAKLDIINKTKSSTVNNVMGMLLVRNPQR